MKFTAALIGTGMVSSVYADALRQLADTVAIKYVMASSASSAQLFIDAQRAWLADDVRCCDQIEPIAADPQVDFVLLTTPPNARRQIVDALSAAGKHVLMEKPIERSYAAAAELVEVCSSANVQLGIMLQHRIRPAAVQLQQLLTQRELGPLRAVEIAVPWWRPQSYYDEAGRGSYERDGGGVLISQAIHTIDLALRFTPPVQEVTALARTTGLHQMEAEDFVVAGLAFADSVVGSVFASTACYPGRTETILLHYQHASVSLQSAALELCWQSGERKTLGEVVASGAGADPMAFSSEWHKAMIVNFMQALNGDTSLVAAGQDALGVHRLIAAIEQSARQGKSVAYANLFS